MKTPAELARLYDAGALDEVAREALRYGAILADTEDPESLTRWRHVWQRPAHIADILGLPVA